MHVYTTGTTGYNDTGVYAHILTMMTMHVNHRVMARVIPVMFVTHSFPIYGYLWKVEAHRNNHLEPSSITTISHH